LKDFIPLTYNISTAKDAHLVLEQVIDIICNFGYETNYLEEYDIDPKLIRIAKFPNAKFLLKSE
jgi:hypothetical protein